MKFNILILLITTNFFIVSAQNKTPNDSLWVDSVFKTLTPEERIAQLFMIDVTSLGDSVSYQKTIEKITKYKIGGLCFFKGYPTKQAKWVNAFQQKSKVPLLIAIDGEWGVSMRLDSTPVYPRQITLGALQQDSLIYEMGKHIASECSRLGIHINFAPVVDINSNPNNPVINSRSFGESKINVSQKSLAYMKGMQDGGIIACAKHFPGHGDTDTDSHYALPVIHHSATTIDTLDLFPFKNMIENNISSIMVAHLNIPSLDSSKNSISSLSKPIITDLLKNKLGFKGLIITDALQMKGVSLSNKDGEMEIKALKAGNDILLMPNQIDKAIEGVTKAVKNKELSQSDIDEKCKKILLYKYKVGLWKYKPIELNGLINDLNSIKSNSLIHSLYKNSITLVKNKDSLLPLKNIDSLKYAVLIIGDTNRTSYQNSLERYANFDTYAVNRNFLPKDRDLILMKLKKYDYIIVAVLNTNNLPSEKFGISDQTFQFIDILKNQNKIILNVFANPYNLSRIVNSENIDAIVLSYQNSKIAEELSTQVLFGGAIVTAKLPVTASKEFPLNTGININKTTRLSYTLPQEIGMNDTAVALIDSLAFKGIKMKAYPGCVILAAKDGKVFYHKSFGYHTYENKTPMQVSDIFDMASLTKIEATTMAVMKLVDEGKIDLDRQLSYYLPKLKRTNKSHIIIRDLMSHQAKLKAWIPFYTETLKNGKIDTAIYKKIKSDEFPYRVADSMYIRKDYPEIIMNKIIESPLNKKKEYVYSDLGMYLMMKLIEEVSGKSFELYLQENFYNPLGMGFTGFLPRTKFTLNQIVPTEIDTVWRKQLIHGDVHDQGAAMMGGICGHAGLFSNAYNLATMLQMLLQKGEYAGKQYFKKATVEEFTKYQYPEKNNRRGLGFDKPALSKNENGPCCKSASSLSYGHSGFTGTYFWVDPATNFIFIFLANRVHPDASNRKLIESNIRTDIHQLFYNAIQKSRLKE